MAYLTASGAVNAPVDKVWAVVADFQGSAAFFGGKNCTVTGQGIGMERTFEMPDGGTITEQIRTWDSEGHVYSYTITDSPLPIQKYMATFTVMSDGLYGTIVRLDGSFKVERGSEAEFVARMQRVYNSAIKAVQQAFDDQD